KKRQRRLSISVSGSPKSVSFLGKGERNGVFIMNFKEIHSNTEFLWTQLITGLLKKPLATKKYTVLFLPNSQVNLEPRVTGSSHFTFLGIKKDRGD
ncbi:MAG: hypothetical protein MR281_05430, partial [Eubacterium sp.]|nr:hypothetical protein [Eubacterium sp.]